MEVSVAKATVLVAVLIPKWMTSFCFTAAGTAFNEAAQILLNDLGSKHDAAQRHVDAGNCFKKADQEGTTIN